jgi:SAM-dependent methyltransferase
MNSESQPPSIAEDAYLRRRTAPSLSDIDCLPLRDLQAVIGRFAASAKGALFDYGCGGSPYRHLFSHCDRYVRADIAGGHHVDVVLDGDGSTGQLDNSFDVVLSSQVLEHVANPKRYLEEARRILAPGGLLILSTHGMFLEHGCPDDYYRWTGFGLERIATDAGFEVMEAVKITPGVRASVHLIHTAIAECRAKPPSLFRIPLGLARRVYSRLCHWPLNALASRIEPRGELPASSPERIYIGVAVLARKPLTS